MPTDVVDADAQGKTRRVGLLYDSLSRNTGDIAIGIALQQVLAMRGIDTEIVNPFLQAAYAGPLVVGGGELIRPSGDDFYDAFRVQGRHVLNGAGVWRNAEGLDYLSEYAFVSARSNPEAAVLREFSDDVHVVPCMTTLLESDTFHIEGLEAGEPAVGIHIVPHTMMMCPGIVEVVDAIPYKKVFIPFTHYNFDRDFMSRLRFDMSNAILLDDLEPLQLHSVLGQMKFNVVSSLHASIFSYTHNVPFASAHQDKVRDYFTDRGLQGQIFGSSSDLRNIMETFEAAPPDYTHLIAADQLALEPVVEAVEQLAQVRAENNSRSRKASQTAVQKAEIKSELLLHDQMRHVINARDVVIETLLDRQAAIVEHANFELSQLASELESVRFHSAERIDAALHENRILFIESRDARQQLDAILQTKTFRLLRLPRFVYRSIRRWIPSSRGPEN